jgi:GntR family transcriptional regulator
MEGSRVNHLNGKIKLDFRSDEPLYLQIARQVEQLVASGELKLGDQLPTVRELATELRINFNTVGRAYRLLDETRLISTQRGRGTYIWEETSAETMEKLRKKGLEELTRSFILRAAELGYTSAEILAEMIRLVDQAELESESADRSSDGVSIDNEK